MAAAKTSSRRKNPHTFNLFTTVSCRTRARPSSTGELAQRVNCGAEARHDIWAAARGGAARIRGAERILSWRHDMLSADRLLSTFGGRATRRDPRSPVHPPADPPPPLLPVASPAARTNTRTAQSCTRMLLQQSAACGPAWHVHARSLDACWGPAREFYYYYSGFGSGVAVLRAALLAATLRRAARHACGCM
jgi:hypothetical protein